MTPFAEMAGGASNGQKRLTSVPSGMPRRGWSSRRRFAILLVTNLAWTARIALAIGRRSPWQWTRAISESVRYRT